jgi:hypothetical protein
MTSNNTQAQTTSAVRLRADGEVDEETLAYARTKIDAVVGRAGLPPVTGKVRITRAAAHHADRPWSATAALHVGNREVVVLAEEATGREVVDQLQDRLRRQTDTAAHTSNNGHRTTPPSWRGGHPAEANGAAAEPPSA